MELTLDQALRKGIEAHKAGHVQEADRYYTAILNANAKHPDANHNMGVLAVGVGKVNEALFFFKTALEANSTIAQYWLSYIDALIKLDLIADAKAVFDKAKRNGAEGEVFDKLEHKLKRFISKNSKNQDPPQQQVQAVKSWYSQGMYKEALKEASRLLRKFPSSVILYNLIGVANQGLGKLDKAIEAYESALSIRSDYAKAFNNLGIVLKKQGKLEESIGAYKKALLTKPGYSVAFNNLGNALKEQGKLEEAIEAYRKALSINPDNADALANIGGALKDVIFIRPDRDLQNTIASILDKERYIRPKDICKAAVSLLKFEPNLKKHLKVEDNEVIKSPRDVISDLNELPLLLKLMSVCPLPDLELEGLLKNLRRSILLDISYLKEALPELTKFQSALALQCFTNEYIYHNTEQEEKALKTLEKSVKNGFKNNEQPSPQVTLALASYKALNQYEWSNSLLVNDKIEEVFIRQFEEPNKEEKLKQDILILEEITDIISSEVRSQYEESPYPRWINLGLPLKPISISNLVDEINLNLYKDKITEVDKPEVLIAGCGTGQHSIETAARFKGSKVLAVDLSLSSLAYARRKTEEFGIENVKYMQADILDLGKLDRQFDIIESAGVLHHMDNPLAGWKVLTDRLKPDGLMRVGLYSELARKHIVEMRQEIRKAGIGSSDAAMKSFRTTVMTSDQNHHKRILNSNDFYSLSSLKDLLFHVQEHRFTIPLIRNHLHKLGLKFSGFEGEQIVSLFKQTNKNKDDLYDLDKWQTYEEANPTAFAGMYQFWCQKVG